MKRKFEFGSTVQEKVTGYTGVVTAHAQYMTGCDQYAVVTKAGADGSFKTEWFDEGRLELKEKAKPGFNVKVKENGCDQQPPAKS